MVARFILKDRGPLLYLPDASSAQKMWLDASRGRFVLVGRARQLHSLLLTGGDKSSQSRDIEAARTLLKNLE